MKIGSRNNELVRRGLFLTVAGIGDRSVFADPRCTVGDVIRGLGGSDTDVLTVDRTGKVLLPSAVLGLSDVRSGDKVAVDARVETDTHELGVVTLAFLTGPNQGRQLVLAPGESRIGRAADNDVVIVDAGVSRYHATVTVDGSSVCVTDAGSTNGVLVGEEVITGPTPITTGQRMLIGQTWFAIHIGVPTPVDQTAAGDLNVRRILVTTGTSPHRPYHGERIIFPSPPERIRGWRRKGGEGFEAAASLYDRSLESTTATLVKELDIEWTARLTEAPSITDLMAAIDDDPQSVWGRGTTDPLVTRFGLATLPSRVRCTVPDGGDPELRERAMAIAARYRSVDGVPVTVNFSRNHSVLVAGHERESRELTYALLGQLVVQHQPNRLRIWSLLHPDNVEYWDWLKWLPHCDGFTDDGSFSQLTSDPDQYRAVVERLAASINDGAHRAGSLESGSANGPMSAVLLIDGEAQVPNDLQALVESLVGGDDRSSLSVLVVGQCDPSHQLELPFGRQGSIVIVDRDYASMESVLDSEDSAVNRPAVLGIDYELLSGQEVIELARRLTCMEPFSVAASAEVRTATPAMFSNPDAGSYGDGPAGSSGLDGLIRGADPAIVVEQWEGEHPAGRLVAQVGSNNTGPVMVDIRELGPHALVSGDLEGFLPAWISALAARYSPRRLNFYLIDSTGGAVFRSCRDLPHTIGNLSDTSTLEIKPALAMLSAELDRREALLTTLDCHSIEDLERQGRSNSFPYLVVGIDRVEELGGQTDDSVVTLDPAAELLSLAERGHRLGMHLLLGSAGPLDERLDDRVALRIDTARYGLSHLTVGQAPVVSFTATLAAAAPEVTVRSFQIDDTGELSRQSLPVVGSDDLERLITLIRNAHRFSGDPLPSGLG